jgi:hypothetical protein
MFTNNVHWYSIKVVEKSTECINVNEKKEKKEKRGREDYLYGKTNGGKMTGRKDGLAE